MGRRKPQVVRRLGSLEEHNAWVEQRGEAKKSRLDRAVEEAADDDAWVNWEASTRMDQAGGGKKRRALGLWDSSSDEEDEDDGLRALDEDDDASLLAAAEAEEEEQEAEAAAKRAWRRRGKRPRRQAGSKRKKRPRRLRRLRRAVESDESEEEEGNSSEEDDEELQAALTSLQAQIKVGVLAPEEGADDRRALLVQRTSHAVEWTDWPAGSRRRFPSLLFRANAFAPQQLRLSPPENLLGSVWEGPAAAGLGVRGEEGVALLLSLCEASPPLAYFEGVGEGQQVHLDIYLTSRTLALARPDNDPPALSMYLRQIRRLLELCTAHRAVIPEVSAYYASAAAMRNDDEEEEEDAEGGDGGGGDGRRRPVVLPKAGAFDPGDLYRCLEEYKAARLQRQGHKGEDDRDGLEVPGLAVTLRPYQRDALRWMVGRETGQPPPAADDANGDGEGEDKPLPHGWLRLDVGAGSVAYYNPFSVALSREPPPAWSVEGIRGGILADEMVSVVVVVKRTHGCQSGVEFG